MERYSVHPISGIVATILTTLLSPAWGQEFSSHPPLRPLPVALQRAMSPGRGLYVDSKKGDDANTGQRDAPWRSISHAVDQLEPGDVLYLRGGVYHDHVTVAVRGTRNKPITIRSFPGEVAVIDGGLPEFFETPDTAWEPCPDGVEGEFRSIRTYPDFGGTAGATNVLGNFGDSMIPLHGYRYITDLRNTNEYFDQLGAGKTEAGDGIYCGPGLFYDTASGRIHARLAHTRQKALGDDNYRGTTDPRTVPLVIAGTGAGSALSIDGARYVRVQDLVVRGARTATVSVSNALNIDFDGVTAYGGSAAFAVRDSGGLRLWNCALRGISAPWTYRGSLKYRAIEARIFSAGGWAPTGTDNHDFELAYSEFTDCVDGVFIGNVKNVRFHHNLLDNVSDDGMFLTATTAYDGTTPGGNVHIYQNLLSRCLTTFAFGVGHGRQKMTPLGRQSGSGVFIYRNIFDFRRPVMYSQPQEGAAEITSLGRIAGDHGGPLWEPMTIYHNTVLGVEPPFRGYYLAGLGGHLAGGSRRRLFNNIVAQANGEPGNVLPPVVPPSLVKGRAPAKTTEPRPEPSPDPLDALLDKATRKKPQPGTDLADLPDLAKLKNTSDQNSRSEPPLPVDFQADGNLHWSYAAQPTAEKLFARFRGSPDFAESKSLYRSGWTANDVVVDPGFAAFDVDWHAELQCRLEGHSPAVDAGVPLPIDWPDPLRDSDPARPDIGAVPVGVQPWSIGIRGRLSVFGSPLPNAAANAAPTAFLLGAEQVPPSTASPANKSAVIVQGYPAFDAPLIEFALRKSHIPFESLERQWLDPMDYAKHGLVVVVGDLPRAKIEPNTFSAEDVQQVEPFLERGGTLLLMRGNNSLFNSEAGGAFLTRLTGTNNARPNGFEVLLPGHAWVRHLDPAQPADWINAKNVQPIRASVGELVIGNRAGLASLYRLRVGRGQLIYLGWDIAASLPPGRSPSTVEQEASYEQQVRILLNVVDSVAAMLRP